MMFNRRRMDQGRSHNSVINRERHYRADLRCCFRQRYLKLQKYKFQNNHSTTGKTYTTNHVEFLRTILYYVTDIFYIVYN